MLSKPLSHMEAFAAGRNSMRAIPAAPANDAVREAAKAVVAREREISWDEEPESLTKAIYALHIALAAERAERERGGDRG
jgi:hypothetical protein